MKANEIKISYKNETGIKMFKTAQPNLQKV